MRIQNQRMAYEKAPDCQHFNHYESHQQAEFSGQKSHQMHTPLQSQYNHLVNKRDGSYSAIGQPRWTGSNGFKLSQNQFQTIQPRGQGKLSTNEHSCLQTVEHPVNGQTVCHFCSVNLKALNYSSAFSQNSILYSQNVPTIIHSGSFEMSAHGGSPPQSTKYLRFEVEIFQAQITHSKSLANSQQNIGQEIRNRGTAGDMLYITVSDDTNHVFLYVAAIDINKFLNMRKQQNIFSEFSQFPEKIQALLDFCITKPEDTDSHRFLCVMDLQDECIVDIFEHNEFRNLLHLRLDFKKATAEETSEWLAKKLLMQKRLNVDSHTENVELSEQHSQDRSRINQIKQSLIALKATQNEELQRIKEEHDNELDTLEESQKRDITDVRGQFEVQIQDLTSEYDERIQEAKNEITDVKDQLQASQNNLKRMVEIAQEKDQKIQEVQQELASQKELSSLLTVKLDDLKDANNQLDKRLLEQAIFREQLERDCEKYQSTIDEFRSQISILEDQNQGQNQVAESLKESLLISNENLKSLEGDMKRATSKLHSVEQKLSKMKEKRQKAKKEVKSLREERLQLEARNESMEEQLDQLRGQSDQQQVELDKKDKLIETYEAKLKEDQQVLMSNKALIEYLNKSLSEAQKYSFRTIVQQRGQHEQEQSSSSTMLYKQMQINSISPLRSSNAKIPRIDTKRLQETTQTSNKFAKYPVLLNPSSTAHLSQINPTSQTRTETLADTQYRPQQSALTLPLTEYYFNKHNQTTGNTISFGNRPMTSQVYTSSSLRAQQFNHAQNNPFSSQLERDRIISEDKLKQRFEEAYQSQYQGSIPQKELRFKTPTPSEVHRTRAHQQQVQPTESVLDSKQRAIQQIVDQEVSQQDNCEESEGEEEGSEQLQESMNNE